MMRRTILTVAATLAACLLLLCAFYTRWFFFDGDEPLEAGHLRLIRNEGVAALQSRDVPVGSILLFGDEVIGVGHNTVYRDSNAGGHAEINAISDAMRKIGIERFVHLNRDSLLLITTYEPCLMCRGAILEWNIRHVEFLKGKDLLHWLREDYRTLRYQWLRTKRAPGEMQDTLFRMHPGGKR